MSVRWITWAWDQDCANPGEKLTLIALADHAGEEGSCWPSSARLVEKTGLGRSTVFRHLDRLEEAGMLHREQRHREDGSLTSSLIILGRGSPDMGRGGSQNETGVVPNRDPLDEPSLEPSVEPSPLPPASGGMIVAVGFDTFWELYPRKTGKPAAKRKYDTARKTVEHDAIMWGLVRWNAHWKKARTEMQFIPHPATWLNQERWNDECPNVVLMQPRDRARAALEAMVKHPSNGGQHELG